jgi:protein TonB
LAAFLFLYIAEHRLHASVSNHFIGGERMLGDTLLESSSASRRRKRWPMATAFTAEAIVAAVVVIIPLLSTVIIPVSASAPPIYIPEKPVSVQTVERVRPNHSSASGPGTSAPQPTIVLVSDNPNRIYRGPAVPTTTDPTLATPGQVGDSQSMLNDLIPAGSANANVSLGRRRVVSQLSEAHLLNRVEPAYPRIEVISGVQGQVKLHAIIARNGTVQSLSVISGHLLLVGAAVAAVGQWRYRPYILNGEAVEVETFITVNFRKDPGIR